jgi:MoaA/NifB/PqqE/SkfB family radical SAM enzyme
MNTNGARLSADLRRELVAHASWIRFSVDASNAATYLKVHQRNEWDKVIRNIKAVVTARDVAHSNLYIGMNYNLDEYNVDEVPEFVALGEELGVDYVAIRPTYWNLAPTGVKHTDIRERVRSTLALTEEIGQTSRRVKIQTGNIRNAIGSGIDDPGACLAPTMMGVVCADGSVAACCDLRGHAQYAFGNIYENSFKEIWEGEKRASVVLQHTALRECNPFCSHAYAYYNQAIDYLRSARPQREFL